MTRPGRWLWCLPVGGCLLASSAIAQETTSETVQKEALAESIVAREESQSGREFDPAFRVRARTALAALPLGVLEARTGEGGLGLSAVGDSQADLVYTPLTPCRIIDTRLAGGPIAAGYTRSFKVTGDTTFQGGANCGIPFGPVTAAVINFVAVNATAPGDLRVAPFGTAMPTASILNWAGVSGLNLANGLAVALCDPAATTCTNDITVQADASPIHIVADVQGYFAKVRRTHVAGVKAGPRSTATAAVSTAAMTPLATTTVTFPTSGQAVLTAQSEFYTDVSSQFLYCGMTEDSATGIGSWEWEPGDADGWWDQNESHQVVRPVTAGTHVYTVSCQASGPTVRFTRAQVNVMFFGEALP